MGNDSDMFHAPLCEHLAAHDPEPQPCDGPEFKAEHDAWEQRQKLEGMKELLHSIGYVREEENKVRTFATGATRDAAEGKYEYTGFLSPLVLRALAAYMHKHRIQSDGKLRASDNWKLGMDERQCLESLYRHVMDVWLIMETGKSVRPENGEEVTLDDALCGTLFNTQILLHQYLQK